MGYTAAAEYGKCKLAIALDMGKCLMAKLLSFLRKNITQTWHFQTILGVLRFQSILMCPRIAETYFELREPPPFSGESNNLRK